MSNEILFTIDEIVNNTPITPMGEQTNYSGEFWHKKANGDNDEKSCFVHCTGKQWIEEYTKLIGYKFY